MIAQLELIATLKVHFVNKFYNQELNVLKQHLYLQAADLEVFVLTKNAPPCIVYLTELIFHRMVHMNTCFYVIPPMLQLASMVLGLSIVLLHLNQISIFSKDIQAQYLVLTLNIQIQTNQRMEALVCLLHWLNVVIIKINYSTAQCN